ncbi:hypothetical protein [Weissella bombi]|uniref:Uncharacterized protein n=1 Tax=Weissella bombi TaxID=1505725 RepID=A0A1C4BEH4_9LACO|nr:hypothetical protein [Weissella bombi]SCC05142.1 hypothetical protein GA0061074_11048 [Weissella bombi]
MSATSVEVHNLMTVNDFMAFKDDDFKHLQQDVADLKHESTHYNHEIADLKSDVQVLKVSVTELQVDVRYLKQDVMELKQDVQGLKLDMAEVKVGLKNIVAEMRFFKWLIGMSVALPSIIWMMQQLCRLIGRPID